MKTQLGFPKTLLGTESFRLKILSENDCMFALEKPANVLIEAHPWYKIPALVKAIHSQIKSEKKEFIQHQWKIVESVYNLDPELSGLALFATNKKSSESLRNAYGSDQFRFKFILLTEKTKSSDSSLKCNLPIKYDDIQKRAFVSHKIGKKSHTTFHLQETFTYHQLWMAETTYPRFHQIRLHAAELGLRILGEKIYTQTLLPYLSNFKKRFKHKDNEKPLIDTLAIHLHRISCLSEEINFSIESPFPEKMQVALSFLSKF